METLIRRVDLLSNVKQVKKRLPVWCKFNNLHVGVFLLHDNQVLPLCFLDYNNSIVA